MSKNLSTKEKLKAIRNEAGLTIRDISSALGISPSSYQHYEDRYKKQYLPLDLAQSLALIYMGEGIEPDRLFALAGYNRDFDLAGDEADEIGIGPSEAGPDGKLITHDVTTGQPKIGALPPRNFFTVGFHDDLIRIDAYIDKENLSKLIKRLEAIRASYD